MEITPLLILVLFLGAMYLLLIRPQQKQRREHEQMVAALEVDDDVVTIGGVHGTVVALGDDSVDLKVTDDVVLRFQKSAVARTIGGQAEVHDEGHAEDHDEPVDVEVDGDER